jgi:hypothetical protein
VKRRIMAALRRTREGAVGVHHTDTSTGSWDGSAAEAALGTDATTATLRKEYAWVPEGSSFSKSDCKLPHHLVSDGTPGSASTVACSAAIAALNGGRGGVSIPAGDRQGTYNHLAAHLRDAGQEPPELKGAGEALRARIGTALEPLYEAGRVLSAANEEKIRTAVASLQAILDGLEPADGDGSATEASRTREAWSPSAWDASDGAYALSLIISLMGSESDEPDQLAMLQRAYDALAQWMTAEVGEIGAPDDDGMDLGMEGRRRPVAEGDGQHQVALREAVIGDVLPLRERAVGADGTAQVKVIAPGWGSSGYYRASMLERDGPKVLGAGTKMFWDHPTEAEEAARPEGSLRDLAAELVSDSYYDASGPEGPGLYARARIFEPYREAVDELAPHIGVSIRAWGKGSKGTAEGRSGQIIDELVEADSIDFVTTPGAGGRVLQLFEAARRSRPAEEDDVKELEEMRQRAARAEEALLRRTAGDFIAGRLAEARVPDATRKRLTASLSQNPPLKEGALDEQALAAAVDGALKDEAEYLAALGAGQVRGFGSSAPAAGEAAQALEAQFRRLGLSEAGAKIAAAGRD